jgi:VWFA-related protein
MMRPIFLAFALVAVTLFAETPPPEGPPADPKPADPPVTFRSEVSLLRVDAQVVDQQNHPITGLRAEDFVLREDGKQQEIRNFQSENMPVDLILLLDVSRSMEPHVQRIAAAAHQALGVLGDQDRIAIMVFDRATRVRPAFGNRQDAERELERVLDQEAFDGGTDIKRGLLDAANYMSRHGRRDARHAMVILTDDQTERDRDDAAVLRALTRADCVLSALIAPDALHSGSAKPMPRDDGSGSWPDDALSARLHEMLRPELRPYFDGSAPMMMGGRTRSAGTSGIADKSGGDSIAVDHASAFQDTLDRLRQRYGLYFYLPEGVKPGEERAIEVELSDAARRRYPGAQVRYRRSYLAPNASDDSGDNEPTLVSLPRTDLRERTA